MAESMGSSLKFQEYLLCMGERTELESTGDYSENGKGEWNTVQGAPHQHRSQWYACLLNKCKLTPLSGPSISALYYCMELFD